MQKQNLVEDIVSDLSKKNEEPLWLFQQRKNAAHAYTNTPASSFKYGLTIQLDPPIELETINQAPSTQIQRQIDQRPQGVSFLTLKQAMHHDFFKKRFMSLVTKDKLALLHEARVDNVLVVHVPQGKVVKETIKITSNSIEKITFDHLLIMAEENSSISLFEEINTLNTPYISKFVEIFAQKNAIVNYASVQKASKKTVCYIRKYANTAQNAAVNWFDCFLGGKTTLSESITFLKETGSHSNNYALSFGDQDQQFDLVVNAVHQAEHTQSDLCTRGALEQNAKSIYHGLIKIEKNASNANGYQKIDTLLLSDDAIANAIPDLKIDNSEVKCSHGASIGKPDQDKLFYLQSRGFTQHDALRLYIKGFFNNLMNKIDILDIREHIRESINKKIE